MKQIIGGTIWNTCFDCHHIVKYNDAIFIHWKLIRLSGQFSSVSVFVWNHEFSSVNRKMRNKRTARLELSVKQIFLTIFVVTCCIFYLTLFIYEENIWIGSTNIRNYINIFPMPRYELYQKFQPAIPKIFINMKFIFPIFSKENLLEGVETVQYSHQSTLHTIHLLIYSLNNG